MGSALPLLRRDLAESRWGLVGWASGLAVFAGLYLPLFPTFGGRDSQLAELIRSLPPALVKTLGYEDIVSGAGYAQSTFFGLMAFALTAFAAVSWGSAAIAGAEESGRLELTLAHGVSRARHVLESALSVLVRVAGLALVAVLLVLALDGPSQLGLAPAHVAAAGVSLAGLAVLTGAASLAAGAATGRSRWATSAGAIIAFGGYGTNAVANQSPDLDWLHALSPYAWAWRGAPLEAGWDVPGLLALWGTGAVLVGAAVWLLDRRDLRP
ncbi:ABC transporter permease subunit [Saccharopolyspora cebuensis]|uniref:ABC transporter permease subunit n=1 Tax=Saccharopolyspora cebuensis TaxID=418759 RepID=A0ABV4CNU7_9PSEU